MKNFELVSKNQPTGDQPHAIDELVKALNQDEEHQTLLGVTGSGKTFTIANVIARTQRPTIVLSHNKTLAAQLYSEFKELFPKNRVEYFVSYFDFYRPEAYLPHTDTYIDKTSKSNWDLEAMRLASMNSLSSRSDTIVVASVAAIYGTMNPTEYREQFLDVRIDEKLPRKLFLRELIKRMYTRNDVSQDPGTFRVRGDVIDIVPGWTNEIFYRIETLDDVVVVLQKRTILKNELIKNYELLTIYPARDYAIKQDSMKRAIETIQAELEERIKYFKENNKLLEAQRLGERVKHDVEALEEFGICPGIENYSRHLDGRSPGQRAFTLFDYLPKNGLIVVDESHMSIPQVNGMFNADFSRKTTLVNYGFRLPSALDNRPLKFPEFEGLPFPKIYVSATPAEYEINKSNGVVVQQVIRPTGLLDPIIEIKPTSNQVEQLHDILIAQRKRDERTLILTLTIKMSEELTKYLQSKGFKVAYIHSELKTLERAEILRKLRKGIYEVVVGINLLREGIDLPEVSLNCILDADKESFFRSTRSLIQMIGRAARNSEGRVYFFASKISKSMEEAIEITKKRREMQIEHNRINGITPQTIKKPIPEPIQSTEKSAFTRIIKNTKSLKKAEAQKVIDDLRNQMQNASKQLNYERAIELRDIIIELEADLN